MSIENFLISLIPGAGTTIAKGSLAKLGANIFDIVANFVGKYKRNNKKRLENEEPHFHCPFCNLIKVYGTLNCSGCETKFIYIKTKTKTERKTEFAIITAFLLTSTCIACVNLVKFLKLLNFIINWYIIFFIFCLPFLYLGFKYFSIEKKMNHKQRIKCIHYDKYTQKNQYINIYLDTKTRGEVISQLG